MLHKNIYNSHTLLCKEFFPLLFMVMSFSNLISIILDMAKEQGILVTLLLGLCSYTHQFHFQLIPNTTTINSKYYHINKPNTFKP
jgi:hypothetical protein